MSQRKTRPHVQARERVTRIVDQEWNGANNPELFAGRGSAKVMQARIVNLRLARLTWAGPGSPEQNGRAVGAHVLLNGNAGDEADEWPKAS